MAIGYECSNITSTGVFIRSMATRGNTGGLPKTIGEIADVMDAASKDIVLIETVGVGQSELDIVKSVDTVVVVLAPGLGDGIQAIEGGCPGNCGLSLPHQ